MELSGFQGLLAGQAVFRAKDFFQLGGLEKKPQTVSLTKDTHLKTDRRQLSLAPMTRAGTTNLSANLPCLSGYARTLLFSYGVHFSFLLCVIHQWVALWGLASHHAFKNCSSRAATLEG